MKVYKFIFLIGLVNLIIPFVGISFIYKQYIMVALASVAIGYSLILRAIAKEKEYLKKEQFKEALNTQPSEPKTIEEVVEMKEETPIIPEAAPKRKISRKPKVLAVSSSEHE